MRIFHTECGKLWGGQELRSLIEVEESNAAGHQAWAIVSEDGKSIEYARNRGTPYFPIPGKSTIDTPAFLEMARLVFRQKPDIICCHNSRDFYFCAPFRLAGIPVVRYRHISAPVRPTSMQNFFYRHGTTAVVATAHFIKDQLVVRNGVSPKKITVIGEGVDMQRFNLSTDGSATRKEFGFDEKTFVVGEVSMMRAEKGFDILLRALALIKDSHPYIRFLFAGGPGRDTSYPQQLKELAASLRVTDRVVFVGWREDVPQLMAACDVIALASTGVEGQSRVIPEAFALRKPVVASRLGGIPELVQHEHSGLLVAPGSPKDLARAIVRYASDPALRDHCAANGYALAQSRLDIKKRMEESYAFYQTLL
jgi:glycosyltransferase involved in cell wall biosynthesis